MLQNQRLKTFYFQNNKLLIKFFTWLHFKDRPKIKIIKLKGFNCFLCSEYGNRTTISPVWDKKRIWYLIKRLFRRKI